jgi:hypothetical protein
MSNTITAPDAARDHVSRRLGSMIDRLDSKLTSGRITQTIYDRESRALRAWADRQYARETRER